MTYLKVAFEMQFKLAIHKIMYGDIKKITEALIFIDLCTDTYGIDKSLTDEYLQSCRLWYVIQTTAPNEQQLATLFVREQEDLNKTLKEILHQFDVYLFTLTF